MEFAPATPPPEPLTHQQLLYAKLVEAEAALQHGELASPPGRSAVDLFRDALELDAHSSIVALQADFGGAPVDDLIDDRIRGLRR